MGSKQEPSWRAMKEKPAFESRRVRTQPLTVTVLLTGASPLSASAIETSMIDPFPCAPCSIRARAVHANDPRRSLEVGRDVVYSNGSATRRWLHGHASHRSLP